MNFKEIYTRTQNYVHDDSAAMLVIIKETINLKAKNLLARGLWKYALRSAALTMTSGTQDYYLPSDLDKILDIRQESSPLQLQRVYIGDFDRLVPEVTTTGPPRYYMELLEDRVKGQPTVAAKVIMYSDSDSDVSPETGATAATLYGVVGGVDRTELISLSAQNVISSTNSYTKLYSITPNIIPVGTLRFTEAVAGTTLLELYPNEISRAYKKIKVYPKADAAYTLYIRYQAQHPKMVNDSDVPIIPDRYHDVLCNMVIADIMLNQEDSMAGHYLQLAEKGIQEMLKEQDYSYDYTPTIRPNSTGQRVDSSYPFSNY